MRSSSRANAACSVRSCLVVAQAALSLALLGVSPVRAQDAASVTLDNSQIAKPAAQVESDCDRSHWGRERDINGHRFLAPTFVDFALIVSYVGVRSGVEFEQIPRLPLEQLGEIDIDQVRVAESIDLQVRLIDRLALLVSVAGLASSATTSRSLIARGGDYRGLLEGGLLFELFRLKGLGTQLAVRATLGTEQGHNITLLPLLDALDKAPLRTAAEVIDGKIARLLVPPYSNVRWDFSAAAAQPFSREFSAQASAGVLVEDIEFDTYDVQLMEPHALELSRVTPQFGLALTGDAGPVGVPVALMLEYRLSVPQLTNQRTDVSVSRTEQVLAAGVYYSGRADLQVGLVMYSQFGADPIMGRDSEGNPEPSDRPTMLGARFMLRYYW